MHQLLSGERKSDDVLTITRKMEVCGRGNVVRPKLWWRNVIHKDMNGIGVQREREKTKYRKNVENENSMR